MLRILWVYFNAFLYVLTHIIPIRKRYKNPEKYSIEDRFKYIKGTCNVIVKRTGSKVIVEGRENLLDTPVLYVANHGSMIDPYFASYAIQKQLGAVIAGDAWFDKIPFLTPWFKSFGCVYVNRVNPREAINGVNQGIENVIKGHSLILFPEGEITQFITNESVGEFQYGGLKIALKAKVPIIPIAIVGTNKIYTTHEVIGKLKKGKVIVKIFEPYKKHIEENKSAHEVAKDLREMIKSYIDNTVI